MNDAFYIGLDLGQLSDYTALTVLRRKTKEESYTEKVRHFGTLTRRKQRTRRVFDEYQLQHLHRFPVGTPYPEIARRVAEMQKQPQVRALPSHVVVDTTGVGLPVFEMLEEQGVENLAGITITGGNSVSSKGKVINVPKKVLVSNLQVVVQNASLRWAKGIPFRETLRKELQNFKTKINIGTGHTSFEAWRDGDHDDMVLSLAMACWYAENRTPDDWTGVSMIY